MYCQRRRAHAVPVVLSLRTRPSESLPHTPARRTLGPVARSAGSFVVRASVLSAVVALLLVGLPGPVAAQVADAAGALAVARAFNAAWNAHDLGGVMALLGPDPVVRQSAPVLTGYDQGMGTADTYGVPAEVEYRAADSGHDPIVLAAGTAEVRAWVAALFAAHHRVEVRSYHAASGQASWDYRAFADPYQQVPGVGPTEGTVTATVQGGTIAALTIASDPASIQRRQTAFATAVADAPPRAAEAAAARPSTQERGARQIGPWIIALALSLAGVVALAMFQRPSPP